MGLPSPDSPFSYFPYGLLLIEQIEYIIQRFLLISASGLQSDLRTRGNREKQHPQQAFHINGMFDQAIRKFNDYLRFELRRLMRNRNQAAAIECGTNGKFMDPHPSFSLLPRLF